MKKKIILMWALETIIDCVLMSTLVWMNSSLSYIFATIGAISFGGDFVIYPKLLKSANEQDN